MRARIQTAFHKLASLPVLRWEMWRDRKWQLSSAQSGLFWVVGTYTIFKLLGRFGHHGLVLNLGVSLCLDCVAYGINKLWIWRHRQTTVPRSLGRNLTAWAVMFGINVLIAWQAIDHLGTHHGRYALGGFGIVINPVVFRVRDKIVFAEYDIGEIREAAAARCRLEMARAVASGHAALMRSRL